jgi:transposase
MGKEAKDIVRLSDEERHTLQQLVVGPRVARDKARRARMLLKADVDGPHWHDGQITDAFEVGMSTIHRLRQRFVEAGLDAALARQPPARSHANSTARRKPVLWPSRAARRRRGAHPGGCLYWWTSWSNWSW